MSELLELATKIFCDVQPADATCAAYLFGQTVDNQHSVLTRAQRLLTKGATRRILFCGAAPGAGYPGFERWRSLVLESGVPPHCVGVVPFDSSAVLNTYTEAEAVVHHCRMHNYQSLSVIAAPFHQLRAFSTAITLALRHHPQLKLFSVVGDPLPWDETVTHSQGTLKAAREQLIASEVQRIDRYQRKGDLAATSDLLAYLRSRDAAMAQRA